ncbi:MAG TPA: HyaD/HybD family hydrogenase maturation endopeptidase [Nitrospirae bacterium]|nr:HyaD/HybD family hydrogenase maturation endopeptidase [Nitrospirota bacterium]
MTENPRITVIGIGNILQCDEGVGVRVVEKLMADYSFPENVELYDGGTTGMHGLLPLIEQADNLVVIDAVNGAGEPGAVYRFTLEDFKLTIPKKISAHDVGFIECLAVAEVNDSLPKSVVVIGVKPEDMTTSSMELSVCVKEKLDDLVRLTLKELSSLGARPSPEN